MNEIKQIILYAGDTLKKKYYERRTHSVKEKYHLLSEADLELHEYLSKKLKLLYPDYSIDSEECEKNTASTKQRIIVDPIDGTTNFICGKPYFTISVAIEENDIISEGYVYNPFSEEFYYYTDKYKKSFFNDKEIRVVDENIENSIFVLGLSFNPDKYEQYMREWKRVLQQTKKCLFWTAPAQTICNVACGRINCFIDMGCSRHGQSAASLILKNAGGYLSNYNLENYSHDVKGIIATSPKLYKEILRQKQIFSN